MTGSPHYQYSSAVQQPCPLNQPTADRYHPGGLRAKLHPATLPGVHTVLIAEIETGTRYRASAYATETGYGVVLADRVLWLPVDMLGEPFGRLTDAQRDQVVNQTIAVLRGR